MYYDSVHIKTDYYTHIMKYMGSKRELLHEIRKIVSAQDLQGKGVLDLFAGTCGVGMALRDLAPIHSNDIQQYSAVIAQGCLSTNTEPLTKLEVLNLIEADYKKNYDAVSGLIPHIKESSEEFKLIKDWSDKEREAYVKFAEIIARNTLTGDTGIDELDRIRQSYEVRSAQNKKFPYIQTTFLFSEMYFSTDQAIAIDSLRYAIDNLPEQFHGIRNSLLAALIHAYSYASAGTGHFAQFRDLSTLTSIKDVFIYRQKSVMDLFLRKAEEILASTHKNLFADESKSYAQDYLDLLSDDDVASNIGLIYADPPYSFVHYSRFYHAIENLCRYDYPEVEHKGRYRKDRHQSPFCIKTKAPKAFRDMFEKAYKYKTPLLVSYSNTGMISLETLDQIARDIGYKIEALEIDHKHSTMGRLNDKSRDVKEALLLCSVV